MPCCALAAFIISQIVIGFGAIRRFVLRSDDSLDEAWRNPATEWRLIGGGPAFAAPSSRRFGMRTLAMAASIEILLVLGATYGYVLHTHHHHQHDLASVASGPVSVRVR
jgi:hypothetical protein